MKFLSLNEICKYSSEKVKVSTLNVENYFSTENMLPNKGGVCIAANLPSVEKVQKVEERDILISNIRPYFKKIWYSNIEGGCSNDVLVIKANENIYPLFLYYVLADDKFFDYAMATAKGTKMPRGDKKSIMEYKVPNVSYVEQVKIADLLGTLDKRIEINAEINRNLRLVA